MTSKELFEKIEVLGGLLSDTYFELIMDGKEYSFIRKVLDDEDINDPSEEAMWWELTSRGDEDALPILEMRHLFTGDVYDVYILSAGATGITCMPVRWNDITEDIEYGVRFSEIATSWSKALLIKNMEELSA